MKIRHSLITAVVAYVTFLIYLAPAAPITNLLINDNNKVSVSSITGSVWSGKAKTVRINNHELMDIKWSFALWRLFTGEVSYDIEASYKNHPITASLGLSVNGNRLLHNLTASIQAFEAGKLANLPIGELGGELNVQIDHVDWTPGNVPEITGTILWNKAAVIVAERAELGDLTIIIGENETSPLTAIIENVPGHLNINGDITVNDEGHYTLAIILKPTSGASNNLRNSLKMVAKSLPNGTFEINNVGELSTLGFM